jgi:glycosyl transferase family 28
MDLAYAAAAFVLCRAGAMTCAELTAVGLPAAYVPLPIGNGEQRLNALPIAARGGGLLVEDAELTADWIKTSLLPVLTNIDQVAAMSEAAAAMGRKDADRWLAKAVIEIIAAERASRPAAEAGREPGPGQPPLSAPVGQAAAEPPGSLFTPRGARQSSSAAPPPAAARPAGPARPQPGGRPQSGSQSTSGGGRHRHAR